MAEEQTNWPPAAAASEKAVVDASILPAELLVAELLAVAGLLAVAELLAVVEVKTVVAGVRTRLGRLLARLVVGMD